MSDDVSDICDESGLRRLYRSPSKGVINKSIDHIDQGVRDFLAVSPLFVLATTDGSAGAGTDASPRGGPAGFVRVLDEHTVAFGDLSGNNRLDSYTNLVANPGVGMLFLIPGLDETLRINGLASVTDDAATRETCAIDGRIPKVAIRVAVTECYVHCGKAFRRSGLWDNSTWPQRDDRPSPSAMLNDHLQLGLDPAVIEADLEAEYVATMWAAGGRDS